MTNESPSRPTSYKELFEEIFNTTEGAHMQTTTAEPALDMPAGYDELLDAIADCLNASDIDTLLSAIFGQPPMPQPMPFQQVPFAKLFDTAYGQVLVTIDNPTPENNGPHIVVRGAGPREYTPMFVVTFADTQDGWLEAFRAFDEFTQGVADGAAVELAQRGERAFNDLLDQIAREANVTAAAAA